MCLNLDDLKLLQMCLNHESLKLKPEDKRLPGTMNMSDVDMKYHQLLLELNGPIWEAVVLMQVHVQWNHLGGR
jgi:hypothetical protein